MPIILFILILLFNIIIFENKKKINLEPKIMRFIKYSDKYSSQINKGKENNIISLLNYVRLIRRREVETLTNFTFVENPKISFISSVYNKEKYIDLLIISIQSLDITDIEIIFVDDCSEDNSIKIINNFMENDLRIKLIKNKKNKGSLYSRSIGVFNSRGDYIIFVDSDDIIISNGISKAFQQISDKNLSMIQYNSLIQKTDFISINRLYEKYKNIITQPLLSYIFYYNENDVEERNSGLWDKIIKRDIVIKSLFFIGKKYLRSNIKIENDVILLFSLLKNSISYQYINDIGYYYIRTHNESISNNWESPKIAKNIVHSILTTVDFLYERTGNSFFEKKFSIFKLKQSFNRYKECFKYCDSDDKIIKNLFDKLLNSKYILDKDKLIIINIETEISSIQGNVKYLFRNKI